MQSQKIITSLVLCGILSGCQNVQQGAEQAYKPAPATPPGRAEHKVINAAPISTEDFVTNRYTSSAIPNPFVVDTTAPDLWEVTRQNLHLDDALKHDAVAIQIAWYSKYSGHMRRITENASRYYQYVLSEVLKRGYPAEIALLPAVESHYDPEAYSTSHAAGMWQFIPSTADYYGLERNKSYDARKDIIESTQVALDYLGKLNARFNGDWLLTMAAYNAGGGTISRAIKNNEKAGKPTDFWSLDLPKQTRIYVPRILAISAFVKEPGKYKMPLPPIKNAPYFDVVRTNGDLTVKQAASLANARMSELKQLNPGIIRNIEGAKPERLLLPIKKADNLRIALGTKPESNTPAYADTAKANSTVALNAQQVSAAPSLPLINTNDSSAPLSKPKRRVHSISTDTDKYSADSTIHHKVQSGDTLWSISRKYNVTLEQISLWNNMRSNSPLVAGKHIRISALPSDLASDQAEALRKINYLVRADDSLTDIAQRYNVSVSSIRQWNSLDKSDRLQPGQALTLYIN